MHSSNLPGTAASSSLVAPRRGWHWFAVILTAVLLVAAVKAVGVFQLDTGARTLQTAWRDVAASPTKLQVQLSAGPGLISLARSVVYFIDDVPAEARLALRSVQHASVGVYELEKDASSGDRRSWVTTADRAMTERGWTRITTVLSDREVVMVYLDTATADGEEMRVAVGVSDGDQLIVVSGEIELAPLVELVNGRAEWRHLLGEV